MLTLILGGGRGTRLFPLTHMRSKPAVPLGGKYRLIDIPISNCLHAGLKRIFVLTQFNSASLNRHIAQTYRLDMFSDGFVEVLAAEQTPESCDWFQGTADAVRQAARHFAGYDADYYPDPGRRPSLSHGFLRDDRVAHRERRRHHHRGAARHPRTTPPRWAFSGSTIADRLAGSRRSPPPARLAEIGSSIPRGSTAGGVTPDKPFVASMGIYVFSREVLLEILEQPGIDFGNEIIPKALGNHQVNPYIFRGYWADVGTIEAFYRRQHPAHAPRRAVQLLPSALADLHAPAVSAGTRAYACRIDTSIVAEGCYLDQCEITDSVVGIRTHVETGAQITRSVLLGADFYEEEERRERRSARHRPRRRARPRHRRQERAHRATACGWSTMPASITRTATAITSATASSSCRKGPR